MSVARMNGRALLVALIGAFFLLSAPKTLAGDAVDLRGKQGIPRDLKGNNPPERSLHTIEPPSPSVGDKSPGDTTNTGVPATAGGLPPSGNAGVGVTVKPYIPPTRPIPR